MVKRIKIKFAEKGPQKKNFTAMKKKKIFQINDIDINKILISKRIFSEIINLMNILLGINIIKSSNRYI